MDSSDRYIEKAEQDASPERFPKRVPETEKEERREEIVRTATASSTGTSLTSSSDASQAERDGDNMSRFPTQRDDVVDLERHPTALSRIQTQRSQHSATVGASLKSRQSRKPLPAFGGGKDYPPALPDREEYVVEV